jgi:para-aminobenzoate synthetase component I
MITRLENLPPIVRSAGVETARQRLNALGAARTPFLFLADFELKNLEILPLTEIDPMEILFQIGSFSNVQNSGAEKPGKNPLLVQQTFVEGGLRFQKKHLGPEKYGIAFAKVMHNIQQGNTYLCNLTFPTQVATNVSMREIFGLVQAKYKVCYRQEFVCFSPECFVQVRGNQIATYPMKGTISAAVPDAEARILADQKEMAEHATIVDLLRNDLSMVAERVRVQRYRYVERLATHTGEELLQVSSEIAGELPPDYHAHLGDLLLRLLPAGSICGAPKPKTLAIIAEAEGQPRGWYTGICAVFDGQDLDSGVMIRFLEPSPGQPLAPVDGTYHYQFRSGGGITHLSDLVSEYEELLAKVNLPILQCS